MGPILLIIIKLRYLSQMNLDKWEDFTFSDNICQAFKNYAPTGSINAEHQTTYLKSRLDLYLNKVNEMRKAYCTQNQLSAEVLDSIAVKTPQEAFRLYFQAHSVAKSLDFDGGGYHCASRAIDFQEDKLLDLLAKAKTQEESLKVINYISYLHVSFLGDIKSEWDIRASDKFLEEVQSLSEKEFEGLLFYITLIARGIFTLHKCLNGNHRHQNWGIDPSIAFTVIIAEALTSEKHIVTAIMPERIPVCDASSDELQQFAYRQFALLSSINDLEYLRCHRKGQYDLHKVGLRNDPDRFNAFTYSNCNFRRDAPFNELQIAVQHKHLFQGDFISYQIRPLKIFKWMLKEHPVACYKFDRDTRRWYFFQDTSVKAVAQKQEKVETKVMAQMDSAKQTKKLVQILDMMPTLDIKLSQLQKSVVASNQNLLCLGRSGTGKTTTSVLRLFAQEVLYTILRRFHEQQEVKAKEEEKKRFLQSIKKDDGSVPQEQEDEKQDKPKEKKALIESSDLSRNTGMKMVFITASPVLTTEVRRFYNSIKQKLILHLQKNEAKRAKAKEEGKTEEEIQLIEDEEAIEIIEDAVEEEQKSQQQDAKEGKKKIEDHELKEMLEFIKREEKDLIDDLHIESQLEIPNSYDALKSHHFPLFVTVKRLIYMLDACLSYSFFSRDHNNNIIGLDSNLGWHNESKGVMMINHYYKESIDYDEQIAKFGKELLEMDKEAEIDDNFQDDGDARNFLMFQEQQQSSSATSGSGPSAKFVGHYHNRANEKYLLERQQLSFEVDYDVFEQKFWPKISMRKTMKKISASLVWTEIFSTIKGGIRSCQFYMGYLPRPVYIKQEGSEFLNLNEKKTIYYIFLEYEKWKSEHRAYDFMDIVNHIQKRLWYGETLRKMKMDFLMVDEVQDLTPKTLQVLLRLTTHNVFFAGDTAQTIAKGVGARFLDLRHLFSNLEFEVPKIVQLTTNYRSHGKILDLANSVVSLIELFFPKTIDKLVKEESDKDGMRPLVIMPLDGRLMRSLFNGTALTSDKESQLASPQFGCNQVLIVRDQQAKEMVPDIFKNMLVLSVYEAKGLEFDDVILYNFFHLGDISKSEWKLLNDIVYEEVQRVKYTQQILDFDCLDVANFEQIMRQIKQLENRDQEEQEYETDLQLSVSRHRDEVYRKFSMLCIELKFLYVAITRPKRRLIIYDDMAEGRKPIQNYWEKLGVVDVVTKEMIKEPESLPDNVKRIFESGALQTERSSQDEWRIQGIKLFKKKYYDAAMKCFQNSEDEDLVKRCMAYQEADLGQSKLGEAENKAWRAKVLKHLSKQDKKRLIKEGKKEKAIANKHFKSAGVLFESIKMYKHSASCYYTGQDYEKAAVIFEKLEQFGQAAECFMQINELKKAAKLYEAANLITKSIECFEACGEWEQLLHCLHRNKDFFKQEERQSLINKYVPVALNSLYKLYSEEDEDNELDEQNKGKMQEMKIKLKYQKKVDVIREEDEEEGLEEDDEEENETVEDEEQAELSKTVNREESVQEKRRGSDQEEDIELLEDQDEIPDLLEDVFQLKKKQQSMREEEERKQAAAQAELEKAAQNTQEGDENYNNNEHSQTFEIIDTTQELKDQNENQEDENAGEQNQDQEGLANEAAVGFVDDFEHLSQYDPEDEFLRSSNSVSIIESILSKKAISQTSDFSIISSAKSKKVSSIISMSSVKKSKIGNTIAFVQSNRDIYAEDVITQKIIYYISLFSDDVSSYLKNIRSKKMLHSLQPNSQKEDYVKEDDFMIDLDDVDSDFVNLILDVLEYFELFRLCLMICNRYHMSERLGRYIISICSKYSNLHNHRFNLQQLKASHINNLWKEKQRFASILAHEAIHNVFTLIEPKFLEIKALTEALSPSNSLGNETYRMMLDLGFWKKIVYTHNGLTGLQLCYKFFDRSNFEILLEALDLETLTNSQLESQDALKAVSNWRQQLVYREFLSKIQGSVANLAVQVEGHNILEDVLVDFEDTPQVKKMATLYEWMFVPLQEQLEQKKNGKRLTKAQEDKIQAKISKQLEDRMNNVFEIFSSEVLNQKQLTFDKFLYALQLALLPGTPNFSRVLTNIRNYFDSDVLGDLVKTVVQGVEYLNMEKTAGAKETIRDALFSTFLLSNLEDEVTQEESSIFKHYKHNYLLMNINSVLLKDVLQIQQAMDSVKINEFIAAKLIELRPKYFMVNNFKQAFQRQLREFQNQFNQKHALFMEKTDTAFILDMDAQFLMVPKQWITKLLVVKLQNLCLSLASELRNICNSEEQYSKMQLEEEKKESTQGNSPMVKQIQTFSKVNKVVDLSHQLHNQYARQIEVQQTQLMQNLNKKEDFKPLIAQNWQRFSLASIRLHNPNFVGVNSVRQTFPYLGWYSFHFHFGLDISKSKVFFSPQRPCTLRDGRNEILTQGFNKFKEALKIEGSHYSDLMNNLNTKSRDEQIEEDMRARLQILSESFQYFVYADAYELFLGLLKSYLKHFKKEKATQVKPSGTASKVEQMTYYLTPKLEFLLRKFLIAVDIHAYLKLGNISGAVESVFDFVKTFESWILIYDQIKLLSMATQLTMIATFGKIYLPEQSLKLVDSSLEPRQLIERSSEVHSEGEDEQLPNEAESEERPTIKKVIESAVIEKLDNQNLLARSIKQVNSMLEKLNQDELAASYQEHYLHLFNLLMAALVNNGEVAQQSSLLSEGFDLIASSPLEDHFNYNGLLEFDYSSPKGLKELRKQFIDSEDCYKYQFFGASSSDGSFLTLIDVTKCQTKEAQKKIKEALNKSLVEEAKALASQMYLSMKVKKLIHNQRSGYFKMQKLRSYQFEDRNLVGELNMTELLLIPQLPGLPVLSQIRAMSKKQVTLRQMVVSKYATNSLDIHYILSKAIELAASQDAFMQQVNYFLQEKASILTEFEDLKTNDEGSVERRLEEARKVYNEISHDIAQWMNVKAEPNLIEVERKSTKFKIKWESLKLFEKKERLIAVIRKKQQLLQMQ